MQIVTLAAILSLAGGAEPAALKVGDPAPALQISKWINSKPIDLAAGKGQNIYVVEFWATWCPPCRTSIPHLTKLANRFEKKNVTIIGVSVDDERSRGQVEPFVKKMGKKMAYPVALDDGGKTNAAYCQAAGINTIPHAFIVSRDGKIAWQGNPLDTLDIELAELVGDKEFADARRKVKAVKDGINKSANEAEAKGEEPNWDEILTAFDKLSALEPDEPEPLVNSYYILALKKKDRAAAEKLGSTLVEKVREPEALNGLSWRMLTEDEFEGARDLKLALALAKKANDLSGGKDWSILDTYARALFDTGSQKEAVEAQKKAVELAQKDEDLEKQEVDNLKESLEKYEKGEGKKDEGKKDEKGDKKD